MLNEKNLEEKKIVELLGPRVETIEMCRNTTPTGLLYIVTAMLQCGQHDAENFGHTTLHGFVGSLNPNHHLNYSCRGTLTDSV